MVLVFFNSNPLYKMYHEIDVKRRSKRTNADITCGMSEHYMPKDETSITQSY